MKYTTLMINCDDMDKNTVCRQCVSFKNTAGEATMRILRDQKDHTNGGACNVVSLFCIDSAREPDGKWNASEVLPPSRRLLVNVLVKYGDPDFVYLIHKCRELLLLENIAAEVLPPLPVLGDVQSKDCGEIFF